MIPGAPDIIPKPVHHFDYGSAFSSFIAVIRDRIAGHDVARVKQENVAFHFTEAVDNKRKLIESSHHRFGIFLDPSCFMRNEAGVYVVGVENNELFGLCKDGCREKQEGEQKTQGSHISHSVCLRRPECKTFRRQK